MLLIHVFGTLNTLFPTVAGPFNISLGPGTRILMSLLFGTSVCFFFMVCLLLETVI